MNSILELSGWRLVESVLRLLKGSFLTKEQAMKVCAVALECVHDEEDNAAKHIDTITAGR